MWTPRRILLLLTVTAATTAAYFAYSVVQGGIDGLPELPAEYLVEPNSPAPVALTEKATLAKEMLKRAFGGASPEVGNGIAYKLQVYMADRGTLLACGQPSFGTEPSRFVEVSPFSIAFFGKPRAPGDPGNDDEIEEITTAHTDKAVLEFDKPVMSVQDMRDKCKMVGFQLVSAPDTPSNDTRRGKVWVTNNQKSRDPGQFLVVNTVGPVYYRSPDDGPATAPDVPQMYTSARVEVIDKRNLPRTLRSSSTATAPAAADDLRQPKSVAAILAGGEVEPPPTCTAEGMKIYLDRAADKPLPPGAKPDKRNSTGYSSVRLIELQRNVQFNLWTDGGTGFPGTTPVADDPAAKDAAPRVDPPAALGAVAGGFPDGAAVARRFREKKLLVIDTPGAFRFDFTKSLARFEADDPRHVSVYRVSAEGPPDELFCNLLLVQFETAGGAKPAKPAAAPAPSGVGGGMRIKSMTAISPAPANVYVSVVAEQLIALGRELQYTVDAPNRTTVTSLRGPSVSAVRDKNKLSAGKPEFNLPGEILITSVDPPAKSQETKKTSLQVNGPGQIDIFDAATGATTVTALWGRSLTQERVKVGERDQDLLKFDGNAEFIDQKADMRLSATRLLLWLGTREDPAGTPVRPGSFGQAVPQRLDAIGNVASKSPELVIHDTDLLKLWFRDVPPPVIKPRPPARPASPQVVAGTPPVSPAPAIKPVGPPSVALAEAAPAPAEVPPKPKPPIVLSARTVESWLVRYPVPPDAPKAVAAAVPVAAPAPPGSPGLKYEMERALCEDRVVVHQDPAEPEKVPRGLDIAGVKLNLVATRVNDEVGQVMTVTGTPGSFAEVHFETTSLFGPVIKIDQVNNTVAIDGVGSLLMPSNSDFSGAPTAGTNELEIRFSKSMFFNGAKGTAEFLGLVNAQQRPARDALIPKPAAPPKQVVQVVAAQPAPTDDGSWSSSQLLCHRLDVTFDRPVYFNQFKRDETGKPREPGDSPKMRQALCIPLPDDELPAGAGPASRIVTYREQNYRRDPRTKQNLLTKAQVIEGRQIEVRLREKSQEMFATGPGQIRILQPDNSEWGKKSPVPGAAPTPPAPRPGTAAPFKLTLVKFLDTMTAVDRNKLFQTASFRNGANVWQIPTNNVNLAFAAHEAPAGTTSLSCNTSLEVSTSRPRPDAEAEQEMVAVGNAEFRNDDYTGHGSQITFKAKDVTLQGTGDRLASIYANKQSIEQRKGTRARVIVYRNDGTIEGKDAGTGVYSP